MGNKVRKSRIVAFVILVMLAGGLVMPSGQLQLAHAEQSGQIPPLLITEIVPDSTNVGTADGYEYIEVYNHTDQPVDFKDYMIIYRYPGKKDEDLYWRPYEHVVIPPGGTMVFWGMTGPNETSTVADFNANYGTNLIENVNIVRIPGGLHNSRDRMVLAATNTGHEIVSAAYNQGTDDTAPDMGIKYTYPEPGRIEMVKISGGTEPATPGTVEEGQVPEVPLAVEPDPIAPEIINHTIPFHDDLTAPVDIVVEARDNQFVRTLNLYYRSGQEEEYNHVYLQFGADGLYRYSIPLADWIGKGAIDYYFAASDGTNETVSPEYQVLLARNEVSPRLNVRDGQFVSGAVHLTGAKDGVPSSDLQLMIDGTAVTETSLAMEKPAYFVFEADGINSGINEITIGRESLGMIPLNTSGYQTIVIPVEAERFVYGETMTIAIRAGSAERSYWEDDPEGGLDDYNIRNARLVLADGTEIRDPEYADPGLILDMGDDGRFLPVVYFHFDIPEHHWTALSYLWDTTGVHEGGHTVTLTAPDASSANAQVTVDNTGPDIETTVEDGNTYKGPFVIDAAAADSLAGVDSLEALLDGRKIGIPYETSSAALAAGEHQLHIRASDKAGNVSTKEITFLVPEEHPLMPELLAPQDGAEGVHPDSAVLRVRVTDPTGDPLNVSFYEAQRYTPASAEMRVFSHAADTEPPAALGSGLEEESTWEERQNMAVSDDVYAEKDAVTQFPYHRFQLETEGEIDAGDRLSIAWEGHTLPGRKVTLYAWSYNLNEWKPLAAMIAPSEEDFTLRAFVPAEEYVRDGRVDILVQDLIPGREDYDYTIAWMSDTQIYTELYPEYYESQVNWIRDAADEMNIRYVVHTGDIVNVTGLEYQWERADQFMSVLEQAQIPYGVLAGNHDVGAESDLNHDIDYTMYSKYFGEWRFKDRPYYGESYKDNRGHYDLVSAGGNDFIFLYMGWGVNEEDMAWMNGVLSQHPHRMAVIALHDYLLPSGNLSATGAKVYENVVAKNKNVIMVLSGHYTGSALRTDELDDNGDGTTDRVVYQMVSNYQGIEYGGLGYLKLLHVDSDSDQIWVNTYSPYLDDYNYYAPEADEFTLSTELEAQRKKIATDFLEVGVYTDRLIGEVGIRSGEPAEVTWEGLNGETVYWWYAEAQDEFGGRTVSGLWSFRTMSYIPAPQGLEVTDVTDTSVSLAWDPVQLEHGRRLEYELYVDNTVAATVTDSVYTVQRLLPDTEYRFFVVAKDETGAVSKPSETVTATTLVNLDAVQAWVDFFAESRELKTPLLNQLAHALEQAGHHYSKGDYDQAAHMLVNFLKHLNNPAMEDHITAEAREVLDTKATALLELWTE